MADVPSEPPVELHAPPPTVEGGLDGPRWQVGLAVAILWATAIAVVVGVPMLSLRPSVAGGPAFTPSETLGATELEVAVRLADGGRTFPVRSGSFAVGAGNVLELTAPLPRGTTGFAWGTAPGPDADWVRGGEADADEGEHRVRLSIRSESIPTATQALAVIAVPPRPHWERELHLKDWDARRGVVVPLRR